MHAVFGSVTPVCLYIKSVSAQTCAAVVRVNRLSKISSSSCTYDGGLTPTISGVSPSCGGTGGGPLSLY